MFDDASLCFSWCLITTFSLKNFQYHVVMLLVAVFDNVAHKIEAESYICHEQKSTLKLVFFIMILKSVFGIQLSHTYFTLQKLLPRP